MDELSSYELCLLISLCYKQGKKAYRGIKPVRQEEHYRSWSELANTVNDYCEKSVITVSIDNTDNNASYQIPPKPTIILEDKFLLEEFLDDYCNSFENGKLKLYNSDRISHQELLAQFRESIDKTKVINEYYIEEIKYIPIILWGLRKGFIKFIDIDYSLYSNKNQLKNVPYIKLNKRKYNQGVLDFGIMLDLSEFTYNNISSINDSFKKINFTKSDKHLLDLARERLENANEIISSEDIEKIYFDPKKKCKTPLNIRISNVVSKLNINFETATGKRLLINQEDEYTSDFDIIATEEDINIAIKKSK